MLNYFIGLSFCIFLCSASLPCNVLAFVFLAFPFLMGFILKQRKVESGERTIYCHHQLEIL